MGVWDLEESGIRGGWRLELSFFHGGAIWEGAFEESELMRREGRRVYKLLLPFLPKSYPKRE